MGRNLTARTILVAWTLVAVTACLSACSPRTPVQPLETAPPCAGVSDVRVEDLEKLAGAECDYVGVTVRFPDDHAIVALEMGTNHSESPRCPGGGDYYLLNYGLHGLVAAYTHPDGSRTDFWGEPNAIRDYQDLEGTVIPLNCPIDRL